MNIEVQGSLEVESSTILGLVGSNQFLCFLMSYAILLKIVPCPFLSCDRLAIGVQRGKGADSLVELSS